MMAKFTPFNMSFELLLFSLYSLRYRMLFLCGKIQSFIVDLFSHIEMFLVTLMQV